MTKIGQHKKKILPCLDIKDGRVVQGVRFKDLKEVEDPLYLAEYYNQSGADELVFYDIAAHIEGRGLFYNLLESIARIVDIPLIVGGNIKNLSDIARVLDTGGSKVSINSGAINDRGLIKNAVDKFGSEKIILSVDVAKVGKEYSVFTGGGRTNTGINALEWVAKGQADGAGELVINSIDTDGVRSGFDLSLLTKITEIVSTPVIASGGAGTIEHFKDVFSVPGVIGGLAASVFHSREIDIRELKEYLKANAIQI